MSRILSKTESRIDAEDFDKHILFPIIGLLPQIPLDIRKDIMTALRVGDHPQFNRRLRKHLASKRARNDWIPIRDYLGVEKERIRYNDLFRRLAPMFNTPIRRAILSSELRSAPDETGSWRQILESSLAKELSTTQQFMAVTSEITYPCFANSRSEAVAMIMHPSIPYRPFFNMEIRRRFLIYKAQHDGIVLIPQFTFNKTIGWHSSRALLSASGQWCSSDRALTTGDLELHYAETGTTVEGPSEMRVAWKYNDLKPRVYYAIGASAYFSARYTWAIFRNLTRVLKSSDPSLRYSFTRFGMIEMPPNAFMVYDFASFTTNLKEFRNFIHQLSRFMDGVKCIVFDTHRGMVVDDVGRILAVYNDISNTDPEFSIHKVVEVPGEDRQVCIVNHRVAGLLGVYGNITGSTALHGLVGVGITGDEDQINTIGDDAGIRFNIEDITVEEVKEAVLVLGDIAEEKFEIWVEDEDSIEEDVSDGWHFVKRPITVRGKEIEQSWMPDFPIVARVLGVTDEAHTLKADPFYVRRALLIKQTCRLMDSVVLHPLSVSDWDLDLLIHRLERLFKKMKLPINGAFPTGRLPPRSNEPPRGDRNLATPVLVHESFREGWFKTLRKRAREEGVIRVPVLAVNMLEVPSECDVGVTFAGPSDRILNVICKLGYVVKRPLYEDLLVSEWALDLYEYSLGPSFRQKYEYTIVSSYPCWSSVVSYMASNAVLPEY